MKVYGQVRLFKEEINKKYILNNFGGIMANTVIMPKIGITVEDCILTAWHKKVGDTVAKGDILFSYETDKTSIDQESEFEGTLLATFYEE